MSDVITKLKPNNSFYNGSIITGVDMSGNIHVVRPELNKIPASGAVVAKYTNRWDKPRYYTGTSGI